jgi:hypothetical protein
MSETLIRHSQYMSWSLLSELTTLLDEEDSSAGAERDAAEVVERVEFDSSI